jgi:hypothetical protein
MLVLVAPQQHCDEHAREHRSVLDDHQHADTLDDVRPH